MEPPEEGTFRVTGMTCENCVTLITDAVQLLPGVLQARAELAAGTFWVTYFGNVTFAKIA
jgi:copper chaperone CopZ